MDKKIIYEGELIQSGDKYHVVIYEDGTAKAKRFNKKTKMWITLHFSNNENKEGIKYITDMLTEQYIKRVTQHV